MTEGTGFLFFDILYRLFRKRDVEQTDEIVIPVSPIKPEMPVIPVIPEKPEKIIIQEEKSVTVKQVESEKPLPELLQYETTEIIMKNPPVEVHIICWDCRKLYYGSDFHCPYCGAFLKRRMQ